jgi:hypothetical protein
LASSRARGDGPNPVFNADPDLRRFAPAVGAG